MAFNQKDAKDTSMENKQKPWQRRSCMEAFVFAMTVLSIFFRFLSIGRLPGSLYIVK